MVSESWFHSLWKPSKKHGISFDKAVIGVLAFEVASLMSKLIHLWQSLHDKQLANLREEISNSVGLKKLVSEDDDYIARLMCMEWLGNVAHIAGAVTRLSKKCKDPLLNSFEQAFYEIVKTGADPYSWRLTVNKMDKKAKKMEQFVAVTANLYHELEVFGELEQNFRKMKNNIDVDGVSLVSYEKRVAWKHQEVKHLKNISIWDRTYDYVVLFLARSLFTVFARIQQVFGMDYVPDMRVKDSQALDSDYFRHSCSSAFMQSSVHPSEISINRFASGPLCRETTKSGPIMRISDTSKFSTDPSGNSIAKSSRRAGKHNAVSSYSSPLEQSTTKHGLLTKENKIGLRLWQSRKKPSPCHRKNSCMNASGPFDNGCVMLGKSSSGSICLLNSAVEGSKDEDTKVNSFQNLIHGSSGVFSSRNRFLNAPPGTLGGEALALHYANIIIVIEKLMASPHLIGHDARDDLYSMLPTSIREALRAKLKPFAKALSSSVYDSTLAGEWNDALSKILEWLAPLAHNMIRWQSERSLEHQNLVSKTNILLVQTLFFANREKTEAGITELLVGLNYVSRYGRELNAKAVMECTSGATLGHYLEGKPEFSMSQGSFSPSHSNG